MEKEPTPVRVLIFTVLDDVVHSIEQVLDARGDRLVGVVTAPGPRSRRSDEFQNVTPLARPGLDVIVSNYPNRWADMIRPMKPDLIVCVGFNWKIPADVLNVPRFGAINGHDAVLPKNRGRNATGWALRTGDPVYGATMHRMTPEFDDGAILSQRSIPIADDEDIDDVIPKFFNAALETLSEALDRVVAGSPGTPQDEAQVTYSPGLFEPEWREVSWDKPVRDVFFQIRSWYGVRGVPRGAFAEVDGERVLITKAKPVYEEIGSYNASPGAILSRDDDEILIHCADGPLRIMNWEPVSTAASTV